MLKRILCSVLLLTTFSLELYSDCEQSTHKTHNNLGPSGRFFVTPFSPTQQIATVALGEFSARSYRAGATIGFQPLIDQRFKITTEGLIQNLDFPFSTGTIRDWSRQYTIGVDYQFILNDWCFNLTSLDFFGSFNESQSQTLRFVECLSLEGVNSVSRRLAGSNWWSGGIGVTLSPWHRSALRLAISWDRLEYNQKLTHNLKHEGLGYEVTFFQNFARLVDLNLRAEFRQPYTFFEALLNWTTYLYGGSMSFGIFGNFTTGKNGLNDTTNYGIQFTYMFGGNAVLDNGPSASYGDQCCCIPSDCCSASNNDCNRPLLSQDWTGSPRCFENYCDLVQWTSVPAIYVPEVLVIPEQKLN